MPPIGFARVQQLQANASHPRHVRNRRSRISVNPIAGRGAQNGEGATGSLAITAPDSGPSHPRPRIAIARRELQVDVVNYTRPRDLHPDKKPTAIDSGAPR